jgi:hypothetical protein
MDRHIMSDSFSQKATLGVGIVTVTATSGAGHPPEFYAERLVAKLIYVGENAPPEIKAQALAYQEAMRQILLDGIRQAILSNHTTIIGKLRQAGMEEAAALVFSLRS